VELSLLVHPDWLKGAAGFDNEGNPFGGSADDSVEATIRWNTARAATCKLVEVRGTLANELTLADGLVVKTDREGGTVPGKSNFACAACGTTNDVRDSIAATQKNGPIAMYSVQGYCPSCKEAGELYNGRFFAPANVSSQYDAAIHEWESRKDADLSQFWPRSEVPFGFMTAMNNGDIRKGHGLVENV
jgi:hypothetical protein